MGCFDGKKGLILGVANDRSIAWAIAKEVLKAGGECGFSHLPDKPGDDRKKNFGRVQKCTRDQSGVRFIEPLDVQKDEDITAIMERAKSEFGKIDFLLHSIAFADRNDLLKETIETSRDGFKLAMDISVYSLLAVANAAKELINPGGSIVTMTYFGGERCVPGYNVMGICKAALDASMRYLAYEMGARDVRVNALSAGPLKTLASSAVGANEMSMLYENIAPIGRNITHDEVGNVGAFLLSGRSAGITGEIMHVDGGYNMMGSPGRMLEKIKAAKAS